mmetsp:Transcript_89181/g.238101  ORF Transcript_89181/g.238101 Transcript_89181/m.238101 type:complete len:338 (-) Transcript_89181:67-1080(-)
MTHNEMKASRGDRAAVSDFYDIGSQLSEHAHGSGGEILHCTRRSDGVDLAVKRIFKRKSWEGRSQISAMQRLDHRNIVQLADWFEDEDHIFVVMELAKGGDLFEKIAQSSRLTEAEAGSAFRQILLAVQHMHAKGVVHCDLKPENILYSSPAHDTIKIADFGFAQLTDQSSSLAHQGTVSYAAPEILDEKPFDASADMWSLGVLLYAMMTGFAPFGQSPTRHSRAADRIRRAQLNFKYPVFSSISGEAVDLIQRLVVVSPSQRLTAEEALRHPWVAKHAPANQPSDSLPSVSISSFSSSSSCSSCSSPVHMSFDDPSPHEAHDEAALSARIRDLCFR